MADELKTILIKDLQEAESAADTDYIAIDNGTVTKKIRVENYNKTANGTAKSYAESAKESADKAQRNADFVSSTVTEITNNITAAQSAAIQAEKSAEAAESATLNMQTYVNAAKESADKAKASEESTKNVADKIADSNKIAQSYAVGGTNYRIGEDTDNARYYYSGAKTAEANSETYKSNAAASESAAATSEINAKASAESATASKTAAATSEQNASNSANYARANATRAESYAIGGTSSRSGEDTDNAKYYAQQAKKSAEQAAGPHSVATSSADGLMSKADKAKLDGIGTGSNVKSVNGKTGAVTLAKSDVGLSSVANLDQSKAIKSIARSGATFTATALDGTTTTFSRQEEKSVTAGIVTVEDADGGDAGLTLNLEPHQSGSGDPSPDNIRPITGWTGAKVTKTGKNLLDDTKRNIVTDTTVYIGTTDVSYNTFLKAGTYTISCDFEENYGMYYRKSTDTTNRTLWNSGAATRQATFTIEEDGLFRFWVYRSVALGGVDASKIKTVQLEFGSTATDYEPYQGDTYDITFPTEAGTVYGGTLDVVNGVLTVDRAMVDLGTLNYNRTSGSDGTFVFTTGSFAGRKTGIANIISDCLLTTTITSWTNAKPNNSICGSAMSITVVIRADNYENTDDLKTALNGHHAVYELATPITYQLTPTEVTMLIGHNTIWMDADGKIKLDYKTNAIATKGDINDHIANKSNPHAVTKAQVGLGSVANYDQSKAIKSITRNGTTFTATALDGTTTTFTQQDYPVATVSADGLMSKSDKAKLDGVADQIAKNTAQIETAGTATNAHSAGEYVMISNALYKVTASVAKGDTWTIGTNVTAANIGSEIGSLKSDLANHSALHVLPLSDIADAQNGFSITNCNVAIQGKIVLCWLSFGMNNITVPQWNDFAIAKLKSGYYPAEVKVNNPVGIIQEQTSGLTGALLVVDNAIKINTHAVKFNPEGWCWGFVAYVLD